MSRPGPARPLAAAILLLIGACSRDPAPEGRAAAPGPSAAAPAAPASVLTEAVALETIFDAAAITAGWGEPRVGSAVSGEPLRIGDERFSTGVGTHAPSVWTIALGGKGVSLRAKVGVQTYDANPGVGSVAFTVRGDGRVLWTSGVMTGGQPAKPFAVDLGRVDVLTLEVTDGGDGIASDHADWVEGVLIRTVEPPAVADTGWNFLLGRCVINNLTIAGCDEAAARQGDGPGAYSFFFEDRVEAYVYSSAATPPEWRKDFKTVMDKVRYSKGPDGRGVLVEIETPEGCLLRSLYLAEADPRRVSEVTLPNQGTCTELQTSMTANQISRQQERGPLDRIITAIP